MKVFVVTNGEYSDYRIEAILSTQEKATEAQKLYRSGNSIEEWEVDDLPEYPKGQLAFMVAMDMGGDAIVEGVSIMSMDTAYPDRPYGDSQRMSFQMWATDEQHAIKIANEEAGKSNRQR